MSDKTEAPADAVELVVPEDLTVLDDAALAALHAQVVEQFNATYGDGSGLSVDDLAALSVLADAVESLAGEVERRAGEAAERAEAGAALAARVNGPGGDGEDAGGGDADGGDADGGEADGGGDGDGGDETEDGSGESGTGESLAASGRGEIRINVRGMPRRPVTQTTPAGVVTVRDVLTASGDGTGFTAGEGIDWADAAQIVENRLRGFNQAQFASAAQTGRHVREQHGVLTVRKPMPDEFTVKTSSVEDAMTVMDHAANETRLPGGSLVAAGGWCAPSEILYDLGCERESRDGLFSLPEIGVRRGGIQWTKGIDFSTIFNGTGFTFTEENDIAGNYGPGGTSGDKPCYRVPCPTFDEARLAVSGLCITAGLLQQRGYPEVIARTLRGALVAHDHKMSANVLNAVIAGSTAVTMPASQVGATAPVLSAIELQVEHYRYAHRMARSASLEAVFPFWVRGVVRADLSRRLGVELLSVTDAQIDGWFRARGVNPQFVYGLDPLTGAAASATAWPGTVRFLLYAAGTWVKGGTDVITLDTIYDSVLLGQNDYIALFSEEGWLVAQRCPDSRVVSVGVCPDGATAAGVDIACNGAAVPAG